MRDPRNTRLLHLIACGRGCERLREHNLLRSFFLFMGADGNVYEWETEWKDPTEKDEMLAYLRDQMEEDIVAYSFVTEAWLAKIDLRTQRELLGVHPKDRSDREDALVAVTHARDDVHYETRYHVEYDDEGRVTLGPPMEPMTPTIGLMDNLFEEHVLQ